MKYVLVVSVLILLLMPYVSKADHCAGGEISYEWVSDSTYRLFFKFYRDCTGGPAPTNFTLCYNNSCNSQGGSLILNKTTFIAGGASNGSPIYTGCPGYPNKCISPTATIPGYQEWWYSNIVTLSSRCDSWRFSITTGMRNASLNLGASAVYPFYVDATLDNLNAQGNSSPFFSVKPIPYVCVNQSHTYNNGAVDPNSDSLSFELVQPMQAVIGNCPAGPGIIPFLPGTPSYNIINNPIQTNSSFVLNTSTGQMNFTPVLLGPQTLAVRVKEYRNGKVIGSVMRDVQIQVLSCTAPIITMAVNTTSLSGCIFSNNRIEGCATEQLNFCFDVNSLSTTTKLIISDNSLFATQGATVSYFNQSTNAVTGCVSWTPGYWDTGLKVLTITAKDTTCNAPGIAISQTFVVPIYISPVTYAKDTSICFGDSAMLNAVGGSTFSWTVLSGSPITSLSCNSCRNPVAKPGVTTQYIVSSNIKSYCLKDKDTVTVTVKPLPNPPLANDTTYCTGAKAVTLSATGTNLLWYLAPTGSTGSTTAPKPTTGIPGTSYYYVSQTTGGCESKRASIKVSVTAIPLATIAKSADTICTLKTIVFSNSSTQPIGTYNAWSIDSGTISTSNADSASVYWSTPGTKKVILNSSLGKCSSADSVNIFIEKAPTASFYVNYSVCLSDTVVIKPDKEDAFYNWIIDNNKINDTLYRSPITVFWNSLGIKHIKLVLSNRYGCISESDTSVIVHELPAAIIDSVDRKAICNGDPVSFHAESGPYYTYEWSPQIYFQQANTPDVAALITANTSVLLKVTNQWGCSASDTVHITTDNCCAVFLPDAFTPNGDGRNDRFHILASSGQIKLLTFNIVDRWGKILLNTNDLNAFWDGTYKGTPQDPDTYFYYLKYTCNGTESEKKGNFILIR